MPATKKMAEKYGEDLAIVFVEVQGAGQKKAEAFAWERKWMGTHAMWTSERPFSTGARGIPNYALLSTTGEVLMKGNPISDHSKIEDAVEAQIELAKSAPEDAPKSLGKAYKAFAKGDFAKAIQEARKVHEKGDEDAEAAQALANQFQSRVQERFARIDYLLENGYVSQALDQAKDLAKATKGLEDFDETNSKLKERLDSEDMKAEIEAGKAFSKLEEKLYEDGLEEKLVKKLSKFVEKHGETTVGKRAKHILSLAE